MSTKSSFKPTAEQQDAIEKFLTGNPMVVNAYAGCGKTSTGVLMAKATPRFGTYVAFNRAIAEEAKRKFPRNVEAVTGHSLAFRAIKAQGYRVEKMTGSVNGGFLAEKLGLQGVTVGDERNSVHLKPRGVGFLIKETLARWQRSDRSELSERDVPIEGKLATLNAKALDRLRADITRRASELWERMIDKRSDMPLGHDGYLKLWALGNPTIPGDYVFLDEAQDTNGVMLGVMRHQRAQVVAVGDRHQQIYEWRGALNAMDLLRTDMEARLSTSWRFGTGIAGYASKILELLGETVPLKGNPDRESRLGVIDRPDAILARTNGRLLQELMGALDAGKRPFVVGGVDEMLRWVAATERLMANQPVDTPLEFFGFKGWNEVREASEQEDGAELRRWVKTVDDYGTDHLRRALESLPRREEAADLVLSTGHKAKGREWGRVRLCDDFLRGVRTEEDDKTKKPVETLKAPTEADHASELRLFYVAATRGMEALDVPPPLAAKLKVVCAMKGVQPPAPFAALPQEEGEGAATNGHAPAGSDPAPLPAKEEAPAGNGNGAKPKRRVGITKDDRELLVALLTKERDHLNRTSPNCERSAHVSALLAKMEAHA